MQFVYSSDCSRCISENTDSFCTDYTSGAVYNSCSFASRCKMGNTQCCSIRCHWTCRSSDFYTGRGISYIFIPTFGYLLGYILGTFINAKIAHKTDNPSYLRIFAANFIGVLAVYAVGVLYFYMASELWGNGTTMKILFLNCFLFTLPGDILKCLVGTVLGKRLIPLTAKYRS